MIPVNHYVASLTAALRLARLDSSAINDFDTSHQGFWRSFHAAGLVLPFYVILSVTKWAHLGAEVSFLRFALVEGIAYVIAWTIFPVIMAFLIRFLDREHLYVRGIVAFNWAAVLQNALYTPVVLFSLGSGGAGLMSLVVFIVILVYGWYVIRTAFELSNTQAWMVIGMDFALIVMMSSWSNGLILS